MGDYKHSIETVTKIINGNTFETKENKKQVKLACVGPGYKRNQKNLLAKYIQAEKVDINWIDEDDRYRYALVHRNNDDIPINSIILGKNIMISGIDSK